MSNFRSGLACTRSTQVEGRSGWICQPTELILVTDQGSCVYDKQERLCTWFGFEFDYAGKVAGAKLQCESTTSIPSNEGNFDGVRSSNASTSKWEIDLPESSGHYYHPQYFVMNLRASEDEDVVYTTTCASAGKEVLRARFQLRFPLELQ